MAKKKPGKKASQASAVDMIKAAAAKRKKEAASKSQ